jgi:DNA-binding NarL/FixJ family response regulator
VLEKQSLRQERDVNRDPQRLTEPELKVAALLVKGAANRAIATELGLVEATVKMHVHHMLKKTGASNRTQLALKLAYSADWSLHLERVV